MVHALNRLGATRTMEDYLAFIANVVDSFGRNGLPHLPPLYTISRAGSLDETVAGSLAGFAGDSPVRLGNGAAGQVQNDGYGAVVLAAAQVFYDKRVIRPARMRFSGSWSCSANAPRPPSTSRTPDPGSCALPPMCTRSPA